MEYVLTEVLFSHNNQQKRIYYDIFLIYNVTGNLIY